MSGQIAAIHRRDVLRVQRAKILRVVPVIEVTAEPLQAAHGREGCLQPVDGLGRPGPSEVAGADRGEEVEAEIGGRGSVGHRRLRVFLKIVRRQHVVRRRHEGLEEAPGAACDQPQSAGVRIRDRQATRHERRQARPSSDGRRCDPSDRERRRHRPGVVPDAPDDDRSNDADGDTTDHLPIEPAKVEPRAHLRLSCRDPVEQTPVAHEQTKQRSSDRIGHQPCLMREEHDQECGLGQSEPKIGAKGTQVAGCRDPGTSRHNRGENREQRRQCDRRQDEAGPDHGSVQGQCPSRQQGDDARRRRQRPPQVIQHLPAADRRKCARAPIMDGGVATTENPRQQLPVAARPAVLACDGHVVA